MNQVSALTSAIVAEGGAMRGIFTAGVLDALMQAKHCPFDFAVGVSAGSTNLIGYLCQAPGRSKQIICDHATRDDFISWRRYLRGGHFCDVSWLWHASFADIPLDLQYYQRQKRPLWVVTTGVHSGKSHYFKISPDNLHQVFPASCAVPLAYRNYPVIDGEPMTDGGLTDSIPVEFAYRQGARDITVILSKPLGYQKRKSALPVLTRPFFRGYPKLYAAVLRRAQRYNRALQFITVPPLDCRIRVISPPADFKVGRFTKDTALLEQGYLQGIGAAQIYLQDV
ncbi:patatin-like phospholipase family protein [Lacimicrobium alkaliphilum]|uniref:Patatin family protein n=1 Tax=Lacimicrobium alkaliphilum TaxID=1526571 RepID=A0ABQ1RFM6_9ALTE|nr:patatin family protein [Lacimicrobium alkaliphilum]GGD65494.1 patatin family protein [Lacimicrobium alkaliphilum]